MMKKTIPKVAAMLFAMFMVTFSSAMASRVDLSSLSDWYFSGTVTSRGSGQFVLGDKTGFIDSRSETDSCHYSWFNESYDYDYAMSRYAFKAPFDVIIPAINFAPTSYGYNLLYIACVNDNATESSLNFSECSRPTPFILGTPSGVISVGARWESEGDVCVDAGGPHGVYHWCLNGGAGKLTSWRISVDEEGILRIYDTTTGKRIAENEIELCKSGWFVIVMKSFDGPITVEEPITIRAKEIAKVSEVLGSYYGGTGEDEGHSGSECIDEEQLHESYKEGYKKGYEEGYEEGYQAAIAECKANPEKCGIVKPEPEPVPGTFCSYYDFIRNELVVPCFAIGDSLYELKFQLVPVQHDIMLRLSGFEKISDTGIVP